MSPKTFFYMSAGLLCLTLTFAVGVHLAVRTADAGVVIDAPSGQPVAMIGDHSFLYANGEVWGWYSTGWALVKTIPMPVSNIQFVGLENWMDKQGNLWDKDPLPGPDNWINRGAPPVGTVGVEAETWGTIKQKHSNE